MAVRGAATAVEWAAADVAAAAVAGDSAAAASAAAAAWGAAAAPRPMNPEDMARMRDAMRDITEPVGSPDHHADRLDGGDDRRRRPDNSALAPDGKKVKDENTKIERKTKWDGGKLVSEINGIGRGKMTQTFAVDPESKQLRLTVVMEDGRSGQPRTITQVYDADAR